MTDNLYIGLMSGTSVDGVDASLISTDGHDKIEIICNLHLPYGQKLQHKIKGLFNLSFTQELFNIEQELTLVHIQASKKLLSKANIPASQVETIGFHGQTIYHNPGKKITIQIGNPFLLAKETGIKVVFDFRKRDIAHGGQGAPLIPIFHKAIMREETPVAIINIGGVSNITYINHNELIAFDVGPGNALIDDACAKYFNLPYDNSGEIAANGRANINFVNRVLESEYFHQSYPKSLDRNEFSDILNQCCDMEANDIIASLTYLTAVSIAHSLKQLPLYPKNLYISGGGVHNLYLMKLISELTNSVVLNIKDKLGQNNLDPEFIESQGFAYLAARYIHNLPSAFPSTTGADIENICGVIVNP